MTTLRNIAACVLLAGLLGACTTTRVPRDSRAASVDDDFAGHADRLIIELSEFGDSIHSVDERSGVLVFSRDDNVGACPKPPRPNDTAPGVHRVSVELALAALKLVNQDQAAGRKTEIVRCHPN